jgi:hypothetical protein
MKDFKLSVDEYQNILHNIHLETIVLSDLNVKRYDEYFGKEFGLDIRSKHRYATDGEKIVFYSDYKLSAKSQDKEKPAIKINPEFKIEYSKQSSFVIDPEFYDIFPDASLHIIVWPYVRELIQNIVTRMGLPPLTLPTIM